ncbi:hypothetical protein ACFW04_013582 [Cataglyphis niger]
MEEVPEVSRLCRILARNPDSNLQATIPTSTYAYTAVCRRDGRHAYRQRRQEAWRIRRRSIRSPPARKISKGSWSRFGEYSSSGRPLSARRRAIPSFSIKLSNHLSPLDRIEFFWLLQERLVQISGPLTRTLRACFALGYTKAWKLVKMAFISKDFRPIRLTSFLLKMLKKLVEIYLRDVRCGALGWMVQWIRSMLRRRVVMTLGTVSVSGWVDRGCLQGEVFSPLLWCLVIDGLLSKQMTRHSCAGIRE